MGKKIKNDAIAYIRSLAQLRGRNVKFAELAVREAATLTAIEAKKQNVIDIVAINTTDLLKQLDGRKNHSTGANISVVDSRYANRSFSAGLADKISCRDH